MNEISLTAHNIIGILLLIFLVGLLISKNPRIKVFQNIFIFEKQLINIIGIFIWPAILLWAGHLMLHPKYILIMYGLLSIMVIPGVWFLITDFMAGTFLKVAENIKTGDHIQFDGFSGQIQKTGLRSLHLKKDDAALVIIPYSSIAKKIVTKPQAPQTITPYICEIETSRKHEPATYREKIREAALRNIWSSLKAEPQVKLLKETENGFIFQVTVYPISQEWGVKIDSFLKNEFNKL